jgi:CBS domain-containing protein
MEAPTVREAMTDTVVAVREGSPYEEILEVLIRFEVSAVPVLDVGQHVLGVVSEADLLPKVEFADDASQSPLFERRRHRDARAKAVGDLAADLMTAPAITTRPDASIVEAARLMDTEHVKRLPVVDRDGRLIGIVTRRDLLNAYLRKAEGA